MVFPFSKKISKRKQKQPVENLYKILNTRANASQPTIKKKYIEMVKMYPPETHPEEFQKIRQAYETLRDPVKRKEYDFMRKFGDKIENLMEKSFYHFATGDYDAAEDTLHKALAITPEMPQIHILLANIALANDNLPRFYEYFNQALQLSAEEDYIPIILLQATMLIDGEEYEEALKILDAARQKYPAQAHILNSAYLNVYMAMEYYDEAWQMIQGMLPEPENQTADDVHLYISWINIMIDAEKWAQWSFVQSKVRKFIKSVTDAEDREMIATAFMEEHDDYYDHAHFKEAELFINLACHVLPKNKDYAVKRNQTRELARYEKEFFRLQRDEEIVPLLSFYAFQWFYEDYFGPEMIETYLKSMGEDFIRQMEQWDEIIVEGIVSLKKKYPVIYNRFKAKWDDMVTVRYGKLNREARRRLR